MANAIELKIRTKEAEVNLNMENVSQRDRTHLLNLLEGLLDVGPAIKFNSQGLVVKPDKTAKVISSSKPTLVDVSEPKPDTNKIYELGNDEPKPIIGAAVSSDTTLPIKSRQLPLINGERSSIVSLGDKLQTAIEKTSEPEHWKTGIMIGEDGEKRYKCYYECECGNKGKRYIKLKTAEVHCHSCNELIPVKLATGQVKPNGIPERDDWGNYYIADYQDDDNFEDTLS